MEAQVWKRSYASGSIERLDWGIVYDLYIPALGASFNYGEGVLHVILKTDGLYESKPFNPNDYLSRKFNPECVKTFQLTQAEVELYRGMIIAEKNKRSNVDMVKMHTKVETSR